MNNITSLLANAQLSNSNWLKALPKTSSLSQVVKAEDELIDFESVAKSEYNLELNKEANLF